MASQKETRITTYSKRMSPNQYALMRDLVSGMFRGTLHGLESINNGTVRQLHRRGFVEITGNNGDRRLRATTQGNEAVDLYKHMPRPSRTTPGELTEYINMMIGLKARRAKAGG